MNNNKLKKQNLKYLLTGLFFTSFSVALIDFFLPYFLKEQGLSALQIGGLFTISIGIGSLISSLLYSKILKKIKLKTGLQFTAILSFLQTFVLFLIPTKIGTITNKTTNKLYQVSSGISYDATIQHNLTKGKEKETSAKWGILDCLGLVLGITLSIILIPVIGFKFTFLTFSLLAIPAFFLFSKIKDNTRPKIKNKKELPKISTKLKIILYSEIIYWLALASSFSLVITFIVTEKLSGSILEIGVLFILLYLSMLLTNLFLIKKLKNKSDINTAITGMTILLISAIILIFSKNIYLYSLAFILEGIGAGIWVPSKTALQWKNTKKENREKVSGYLKGREQLMYAIGPLFGGFLITKIGTTAPFYFKAGISLISLGIYLYIKKKK